MRTIANLFGRSPFIPLQAHMQKVAECVELVPAAFEAFIAGEGEKVEELAGRISKLEHEADQIKHDIAASLPRGLFMPVDRARLVDILGLQDSLANRAENIAKLMTFKAARAFPGFDDLFRQFLAKCTETFDGTRRIVGELDELLESGFGGAEAEKVRAMVDQVALTEHEADVLNHQLIRELLLHEDQMSYGDFFLWTRIIRQTAQLSDRAESLAIGIRMTLENK
jgi:predicted phosphate transport protein (TIGR00153 family)